jgi:hypothetical protein
MDLFKYYLSDYIRYFSSLLVSMFQLIWPLTLKFML